MLETLFLFLELSTIDFIPYSHQTDVLPLSSLSATLSSDPRISSENPSFDSPRYTHMSYQSFESFSQTAKAVCLLFFSRKGKGFRATKDVRSLSEMENHLNVFLEFLWTETKEENKRNWLGKLGRRMSQPVRAALLLVTLYLVLKPEASTGGLKPSCEGK